LVTDLDVGVRRTDGGIIIPDDDMKDRGIRDRWCRVWSVGPEVKDLKAGEWVLVQHGRWTLGMDLEGPDGSSVRLWRIEYPDAALMTSDEDPRLSRHVF
jgi:hypothetical protein